jgi:hypothetical protein
MTLFRIKRFKKSSWASQMPFRRIGLDQHLCRSREIVLGHSRRSNHHDLANAPLVGRFELFPDQTSVVAATREAVDRSDLAIGSNALKGLFHLRISGIIITSNIEHFSLEPQTIRVRECSLIVELTSRFSAFAMPRSINITCRGLSCSDEGGSIVGGESVEGPTSRVATKGTTVRHFISEPMPHLYAQGQASNGRASPIVPGTSTGHQWSAF